MSHHHLHRHLRRLAEATSTQASAAAASENQTLADIAKYATALNGVNQPMNNIFRDALWWSLGIMGMLILVVRLFERASSHIRRLVAMSRSGQEQVYWKRNKSTWFPKIKRNLLYAPLWNKRHNREVQLSSALNMGTLPSRLHALLLWLYLLSNIGYCVALNYQRLNKYSILAELRGRSGVLAVINMIALVIFAGRNNPLISMLKISFDTYNLLHRWIGRTIVLEAVVHTLAWAYVKHAAAGWDGIWKQLADDEFATSGMVGTAAMVFILLLSPSPLRHAFYETFLNVHIILAVVAFVGTYIHCKVAGLPQIPYMQTIFTLWGVERFARVFRILYCNYSRKGWTTATIEALPGDACRVTMHLPKHFEIKPGTHAYLRFATLNSWESHPFSIAWTEHVRSNLAPLPINEKPKLVEDKAHFKTDVSFIIQAQTGLTKRLFDKANACKPRCLTLRAALEGPYAGHHSLNSYGTVMLVAGASGITHQIAFVRQLIDGFNDGTVATRKICLIWVVRDVEQLEWIRPWMDEILRKERRREILTIKLFITRPKNPREVSSPSSTVQMFPGRPDINHLLQNEVKNQVGAMCVTVCGPGGLADNVREAVRNVQEAAVVDFIEESFTW